MGNAEAGNESKGRNNSRSRRRRQLWRTKHFLVAEIGLISDAWRKQAFSQVCAVCSPFYGSMSEMALRQLSLPFDDLPSTASSILTRIGMWRTRLDGLLRRRDRR